MFQHTQELLTNNELARLKKSGRGWFSGGLVDVGANQNEAQPIVDVYRATVNECFVPYNFNEEHPLYLLNVQGAIVILFGQWMYDPHTLITPNDVFSKWDCFSSFFERFTLRGLVDRGITFKLCVEGASFVEAHKLPADVKFTRLREFQIIKGSSATIVADLQNAGLIKAVGKRHL